MGLEILTRIFPVEKPASIFDEAFDATFTGNLSTKNLAATVYRTLFCEVEDTYETNCCEAIAPAELDAPPEGSASPEADVPPEAIASPGAGALHEPDASLEAGASLEVALSSGIGVSPSTSSRFKVSVNNVALDFDSICGPGGTVEEKGQLALEGVEKLIAWEFERQNHSASLAKVAAKEVAALMLSGEFSSVDESVIIGARAKTELSPLKVVSSGMNIAFFDGFMLLHKTSGWTTIDPTQAKGGKCELVTDFAVRIRLDRSSSMREIFTPNATEKYTLTAEPAFFHVGGFAVREMTGTVEQKVRERVLELLREVLAAIGIDYHERAPTDMDKNGIHASRCPGMTDLEDSDREAAPKGVMASSVGPGKVVSYTAFEMIKMSRVAERLPSWSTTHLPRKPVAKTAPVLLATDKMVPTPENPVLVEEEDEDGFSTIRDTATEVASSQVKPENVEVVQLGGGINARGQLAPAEVRSAITAMLSPFEDGGAWRKSDDTYDAGVPAPAPKFLVRADGAARLLVSSPVHDLDPKRETPQRLAANGNRSIDDVIKDLKTDYSVGPVRVLIPVSQGNRTTFKFIRRAHWVLLDLQFDNGVLRTTKLYDSKASSYTYDGTMHVQNAMERAEVPVIPVGLHCKGDQGFLDNINCGRFVIDYVERAVAGGRLGDERNAALIAPAA
ncbi:hypothetical protein EOS_35950 [Caballeronia mineralivorans PML1(12)]|uniref:Uncharacterized protein n=1 Tax=Caballeronia mineralivorans PML1(12) TaxID=908627 RepID=A0A0J1CLM6_9BURK|nr:hypothetical protein [Caballeronia mineralivorans]KLU21439.1 hypothetical protein EOS_35950 [Caballeronia mineralivorans PML1(12)]